MTENDQDKTTPNIFEDDAEVVEVIDPYKEAYAANRKLHERSLITFQGGPVDGQTIEIPNGVNELAVDSPFGKIRYFRLDDSNIFVPIHVA